LKLFRFLKRKKETIKNTEERNTKKNTWAGPVGAETRVGQNFSCNGRYDF
jgi:hypothetical protein